MRNQAHFSISAMSRVLRVSRSGYYSHKNRKLGKRQKENQVLSRKVVSIYEKSHGIYGAPRICNELKEEGISLSQKRVARLMKSEGLVGISRRKRFRRPKTTERDKNAKPAPDLVNRKFEADRPDQLWVSDITYVPTLGGFLYLAIVLDVWSRKIVGWAMRPHLQTELVLSALEMATQARNAQGVIHHSDQGCQYTSIAFGKRCEEEGVVPSMGSVGDAYDNAMAESFFASLECEWLDQNIFLDHDHAKRSLFYYIESFYNKERRHSAIDYLSPINFELANSNPQHQAA